MRKALIVVLFWLGLCGSVFGQTKSPDTVKIVNLFDDVAVSWFHTKGTGTIKGNAQFKSKDGEIRFGKEFAVELMPFTLYAEERLSHIYKTPNSGSIHVEDGVPKFTPDPEAYHKTIKVFCDENGNFEFKDLPAGEYYMIAFMLWDHNAVKTGGALMQRLTLSNAQVKEFKMKNF